MHISDIRPVYPDRHIQNPAYPRKGKKSEGDFSEVLESELKKDGTIQPTKVK